MATLVAKKIARSDPHAHPDMEVGNSTDDPRAPDFLHGEAARWREFSQVSPTEVRINEHLVLKRCYFNMKS
jgi:hypothetical protein